MASTATKTTKPSAADGLAERGRKLDKARADASALGTELATKLRQVQALADERRRLVHRDPTLVDHLGVPVGPNNPVGKVDQEVEKLGDLQDLAQRAEHARQIERSAQQSWDDYVASHFSELLDAKREEAVAVAASANEAARAFEAELRNYMEFHGRIAGLTRPVPGIDTRIVPGLNTAADLLRLIEPVDLVPPIPEEIS
jgi:hypothetical protein